MGDTSKRSLVLEYTAEDHMMFMDGYDDCIIGICCRYGQPDLVAYDIDKVMAKLQESGMTEEEAEEFFSYNQIGAWMGERTPVFLKVIND